MKKTVKQSQASILAKELDWEDSKAKPWGQVANYHGWTAEIVADEDYGLDQFLDQDLACSLFWDDSHAGASLNAHDEKAGLSRAETTDEMIERVGALYAYCSLGRSNEGVTLVVTKETRWAEWGKGSKGIRLAKNYLAVMKKEFQRVADGEVYGFLLNDPNGEQVDSCWGFIGYDYAKEEAARNLLTFNGQDVGTPCINTIPCIHCGKPFALEFKGQTACLRCIETVQNHNQGEGPK